MDRITRMEDSRKKKKRRKDRDIISLRVKKELAASESSSPSLHGTEPGNVIDLTLSD